RAAKQTMDRLLKQAGGAMFVAQKTPVPGDRKKAQFLTVMHLAGCPRCDLSNLERLASGLPIATATTPQAGSGLIKTDDIQEGLEKNWVPCPHCRPFRWGEPAVTTKHITDRLIRAEKQFTDSGDEATKVE